MVADAMLDYDICSILLKHSEKKFWRKHIKFGDSDYNGVKEIGNLTIQDGGRLPC